MNPVMNGSIDFDRPVRVEPRDDDIGANFFAPVPQAVASYDDRVVAFLREHLPGIEPHAERWDGAGG
jgi:hypothetical protein